MKLLEYIRKEFSSGITAFGTPVFYGFLLFVLWHADVSSTERMIMMLLTVEATGALIKYFFPTERPIPRSRKTIVEKCDAGSFPSVHSARTAAITTALFFTGYPPWVWLMGIFITAGVGWSRIELRHHRITDVLGGYSFGLLFGFLFLGL